MDVNRALLSVRHRFDGQVNTQDLIARVGDLLPLNEENYKVLRVKGTPTDLKLILTSVSRQLIPLCKAIVHSREKPYGVKPPRNKAQIANLI